MSSDIAAKLGSPLVPSEKNEAAYWQFDKAFYTEACHMFPWTQIIILELIYAPGL